MGRFVALFVTAVVTAQDPGPAPPPVVSDPAEVNRRFEAAYDHKDWAAAIHWGLQLEAAMPGESGIAYNLACVHALSGDTAGGLRWLGVAADRGFSDSGLLSSDADLRTVRAAPGFGDVVQQVKTNQGQRRADLATRIAQHPPLILAPSNLDPTGAAPLIVALHPFGGTAEGIAEIWTAAAAEWGAVLVAPRALRPRGDGFQWGSVDEARAIVDHALTAVQAAHRVDGQRIVLTGFSQGGFMAFNLGLQKPRRYAGVIPVAGEYVSALNDLTASPPEWPKFFIMVGADDRALPSNRTAVERFTAVGVPHELHVYEGVGHAFPRDRAAELRKALRYVLGAPPGAGN